MSGAIAITTAVVAVGAAVATEFATFAVIAAVGATIGAVGAVTHSRELMIAGGVIGAVGAIGGLASSASLFGEFGLFSAGEGAAAQAAGLAGDVSFVAPAAGETMAGIVQSAEMSGSLPGVYAGMEATNAGSGFAPLFDTGQYQAVTDVIDMVNGITPTPAAEVAAAVTPNPMAEANVAQGMSPWGNDSIAPGSSGTMGTLPDTSGVDPTVVQPTNPPPLLGTAADPAVTSEIITQPAGGVVTGGTATNNPINGVGVNTTGAVNGGVSTGLDPARMTSTSAIDRALDPTLGSNPAIPSGSGSADSMWSSFRDFIATPGGGTTAAAVARAAGSFISGATNELTPAQISAYRAQAQANIASANLSNQQAATIERQRNNLSGAVPVASRRTRPGLMNTAALPQQPVTGVPA